MGSSVFAGQETLVFQELLSVGPEDKISILMHCLDQLMAVQRHNWLDSRQVYPIRMS